MLVLKKRDLLIELEGMGFLNAELESAGDMRDASLFESFDAAEVVIGMLKPELRYHAVIREFTTWEVKPERKLKN